METQEIFSQIKTHMLEGMVFHDEMMRYWDFLALKGYKAAHKHHYEEETKGYRDLCSYYIRHYNMLIQPGTMTRPDVIPDSWYKYYRQEVDASTKRTAVKNGFMKWVEWEEKTKELYEQMCKELYMQNEISAALYFSKFVNAVDEELSKAYKKQMQLDNIVYDISFILAEQEEIYQRYT